MHQNEQKTAGILLKMERILQEKGQKEVCYGICVTSYLSKIERGLVNPDETIIKQLFERLSIVYETDPSFLRACKVRMKEYEKRMQYYWGTKEEYLWLKERKMRLRYSPLAVEWLLIECKEEGLHTELLEKLEGVMDERQRAYYYLLKGRRENKPRQRLSFYLKAQALLNNAFVMCYVLSGYYETSSYNEVHSMENLCVAMALEEGNTYALAYYYYISGSSYACVDMVKMMERYYGKVIHLLFYTEWKNKLLPELYYNMGSVYGSLGDYDLAIKYLDMAGPDDFLLFHKKAMVRVRKGEIEGAAPYLAQMESWITGEKSAGTVEKLMYRELIMECQPRFMENGEYQKLLEQLVGVLKKERHFGYLFAYRDVVVNTYKIQRKYKQALEFEQELSGKLVDRKEARSIFCINVPE